MSCNDFLLFWWNGAGPNCYCPDATLFVLADETAAILPHYREHFPNTNKTNPFDRK